MGILTKAFGFGFLAFLVAVCASCGGGGGTTVEPPPSQSAAVAVGYVVEAKANTVTSFLVDEETGALTKAATLPTGNFPAYSAVTPDRKTLFVANMKDGTVSRFSLDGRGGMQVAGVATKLLTPNAQATQIAIAPSGRFLYIGTSANTVEAFQINAAIGELTPVQDSPVSTVSTVVNVAVSHSGQFLFVTGQNLDTIETFTVDSITGKLTSVPTSPVHTGFAGCYLSVHPSDKYLFMSACEEQLLVFSVNDSGELQEIVGSRQPGAYLTGNIAVAPNGKALYVESMFFNNGILAFTFDPITGKANSVPGSPFHDGQTPNSVAVSPTGKILVVSRINPGHIATYRVDQNTGVLTSISGSLPDSGLVVGNSPNHVVLVPRL